MRAVQVRRFGGPEVLELTEVPNPHPQPGHLLIDVRTAGVNFADTHQIEDSYLARQELPFVPGLEVVGMDRDERSGGSPDVVARAGLQFSAPSVRTIVLPGARVGV